jgi:flagellar biosynthetic protein FliR
MINLTVELAPLQLFFMVFIRVSAIIMSIPIFKSRSIPIIFKLGFAFATSIFLFPVLELQTSSAVPDVFTLAIGVIGEILLGVIIGLSVSMLFAGIQMAGQLAGFQMGMALANVMDPDSSQQFPILSQFKYYFALLIFLSTNAHHWFLRALGESFQILPPFQFQFSASLMHQIIHLSGAMFVVAIKVGAPVIAALFLTSVAFGLIARTMPQMNVFFVAMPLKIAIGLIFIGICLPYLSSLLLTLFGTLGQTIFSIFKAIA